MTTTNAVDPVAVAKVEAALKRVRVAKVRTCRGNEGDAFSCDILFDVKGDGRFVLVAQAEDDGNGGCVDIHEVWSRATKGFVASDEYKAFRAWSETLDSIVGWDERMADLPYDIEILIGDAVESERSRKACATKVVLKRGTLVRTANVPPTQSNIDRLKAQYPAYECLNERFGAILPETAAANMTQDRWRASCARFGFTPADFGRSFKDSKGRVHTIADILPRRRQSIVTDCEGKQFCWAPESAHAALAKEARQVEAARREDLERDLLARFGDLGWSMVETGGGCCALRYNIPSRADGKSPDHYLLATDGELGAALPSLDTDEVLVGLYDDTDGCEGLGADLVPLLDFVNKQARDLATALMVEAGLALDTEARQVMNARRSRAVTVTIDQLVAGRPVCFIALGGKGAPCGQPSPNVSTTDGDAVTCEGCKAAMAANPQIRADAEERMRRFNESYAASRKGARQVMGVMQTIALAKRCGRDAARYSRGVADGGNADAASVFMSGIGDPMNWNGVSKSEWEALAEAIYTDRTHTAEGTLCREFTRAFDRAMEADQVVVHRSDLAALRTPSVHLNGTSRGELLDQQLNAMNALRAAMDALAAAAPNGRDYYPQGATVIDRAVVEHRHRLDALQAVYEEVEAIAVSISEARQVMNSKNRCKANLRTGAFFHVYRCDKNAKPGSDFCGIHDPAAVERREAKQRAVNDERAARLSRQMADQSARRELAEECLKRGISCAADLRALLAAGQALLAFAASHTGEGCQPGEGRILDRLRDDAVPLQSIVDRARRLGLAVREADQVAPQTRPTAQREALRALPPRSDGWTRQEDEEEAAREEADRAAEQNEWSLMPLDTDPWTWGL